MARDSITKILYREKQRCPFCNGKIQILIGYQKTFQAKCINCGREWSLPTKMQLHTKGIVYVKSASIRQAIRDWNTVAIQEYRNKQKQSNSKTLGDHT